MHYLGRQRQKRVVVTLKKTVFVIIMLFLVSLSGCQYDLYCGDRPGDYGTAVWKCEAPNAYFEVLSDDCDKHTGELIIDNRKVPINVCFITGTNRVWIGKIEEDGTFGQNYLQGECIFSPEKLTIKVVQDIEDTLLFYEFSELVFIKQ